jgi:hypothetical protein
MREETIKDVMGQTLGFVRNDGSGRGQAFGVQRNLLGSYDPVHDITKDQQGRMIAKGNVLAGLVWRNRR